MSGPDKFAKRIADGVEDIASGVAGLVANAVRGRVEEHHEHEHHEHERHEHEHEHHEHGHGGHHSPPPPPPPPPAHNHGHAHGGSGCCGCCCCGCGRHGGTGTGTGSGTGRPTHTTGGSDGSLSGGVVGIGGVVGVTTRPPGVWPGTRGQLYLPYLFIRANAGDLGARPVNGVFWESPDILIEPGVKPESAPPVPATLGGVAKANDDNTIYAHVWNLGQAPCPDTLVEFYWFNPTMGFNGNAAHLIGATWVNLAARGSQGSHKLVRCPVSWRAQYLNGGHECLVVRISQNQLDPLSNPLWDASQNRHIGQRNIHVMSASEAASNPTLPIAVGPTFGATAALRVDRHDTTNMPWLHLVTMDRTTVPGTGAATGDVGITPPTPVGTALPNLGGVPDPRGLGLMGTTQTATGDNQQVGFHANDGNPGAGNAHVYRVTGTQDGALLGGYTVVVLGE